MKTCPACGRCYGRAATFCEIDGSALDAIGGAAEAASRLGEVLLGRFVLDAVLGQGGMGTVYEAVDRDTGESVAIKVLHPQLTRNEDAVRRFKREARIATAVAHPNLVRVFLFGQLDDGSLYLVMERLRGRSLAALLEAERALDVGRALHIALQVCEALGAAHAQGVVHRDVKPENVFITERRGDPDFVKVLDFGIARLLSATDTQATASGMIFGTARYISPEGASGEPTDARSDVYSIAVLTYLLLAGRTPFDDASPVALLLHHVNTPPPPIAALACGGPVPGEVAEVVLGALAKDPAARPSNAAELGAALRRAARREGIDIARATVVRAPASPSSTSTPEPLGSGADAASPPAPPESDLGALAEPTQVVGTVPVHLLRSRASVPAPAPSPLGRPSPSSAEVSAEPSAEVSAGAAIAAASDDSTTLARAPSPFSDTTGVEIAGLRRLGRRRSVATPDAPRSRWRRAGVVVAALAAFAVGAAAVAFVAPGILPAPEPTVRASAPAPRPTTRLPP
ncbi:MAG: serine/threonine protein kinase, partial [Myxococcales bacterium]|nr:serine/threonine protein kinase [Myxococcales bacterium]